MSGPSGLFTMAASSARDTQYDAGGRRIERLDYSLAEAAFLCRVAKAGGYFLRRQFLDFTGQRMGHAVVDFTGRLVRSRHATAEVLGRGTHVYHLSSRAIYLAAGCEDIKRLRRRRPRTSVKACLMALDVLLAHPHVRFMARLDERVAWVETVLMGAAYIPRRTFKTRGDGPTTTKPFVEKVMIGVPVDARASARAWFVYLEGGSAPTLGFAAFLRKYQHLLSRVGKWRLTYAADAERHAQRARREFKHWAGLDQRERCTLDPARVEVVLDYFRLRDAHAANRWQEFTTESFNRFLDLRDAFNGEADGLYAHWREQGDAVVWDTLTAADGVSVLTAPSTFDALVLPHSYPVETPF